MEWIGLRMNAHGKAWRALALAQAPTSSLVGILDGHQNLYVYGVQIPEDVREEFMRAVGKHCPNCGTKVE